MCLSAGCIDEVAEIVEGLFELLWIFFGLLC